MFRHLSKILVTAATIVTAASAAIIAGGGPATAAPGTAAPGHGHASSGWVGTWESAQVQAASTGLSATGFTDQTVRDVIHTSVGGRETRIRLSNVFGTGPLVVSDVHVALRASGAATVPGTTRQVLFGGQRSVTIGPGDRELSDPVELRVSAETDLAVSVYFQQPTGPATWHPEAVSTNYYAAGDASADTDATAYTHTTPSWYFLDGVDVLNPSVKGAVVTFGPSTTDGNASTVNGNERYPDDLARRLLALPKGQQMSVLNSGISGNQLFADAGTNGQSALNRFLRDVVEQTGVRSVIVWEGTNDILGNSGLPLSDFTSVYGRLIDIAHAHGIAVIGATLQPDEGVGSWTAVGNVLREAVNNWILTEGGFDGTTDFSATLADPANPDRMLPAYDSGDHLHPNDAGYQALADSVDLGLLATPYKGPYPSGFNPLLASLSSQQVTIAPGDSTTVRVEALNVSPRPQNVQVSLSAPSGLRASPGSGTISLPPDGTGTLAVTVSAAASPPRSYYSVYSVPVALATGPATGSQGQSLELTAMVGQPGSLKTVGYADDYSAGAVTPLFKAVRQDGSTTLAPGNPITVQANPDGIAVSPDGGTAYVTCQGSAANSVVPVDTATGTAGNPIAVGQVPLGIAITPDGKDAYVADYGSNTVDVIDLASRTVVASIGVGSEPYGVAVTPDGSAVYVSSVGTGTVTPIDTATNTAGTPIPVGGTPRAIVISPDGVTAYVASQAANTVTPIDIASGTPGSPIALPGAGAYAEAIDPANSTLYVTESGSASVVPVSLSTLRAGAQIPVSAAPQGIAVSPAGDMIYATSVGENAITPIQAPANAPQTPVSVSSPFGIAFLSA